MDPQVHEQGLSDNTKFCARHWPGGEGWIKFKTYINVCVCVCVIHRPNGRNTTVLSGGSKNVLQELQIRDSGCGDP